MDFDVQFNVLIDVFLGGDCELATLINALTYIKTKLEEKADETV